MQSQKRKIAVIGTVNYDTVHRSNGSIENGYGGILYNLVPMAQICTEFFGDEVEIWPVAKVGSDHADEIMRRLRKLPDLRLDAITIVDAPNNHCHLTYQDDSNKTENLEGWVGAVSRRQLRLIVDADWILVNFISGGDITMKNLRCLRRETPAKLYVDVHSRTLGRRNNGSRFLRKPRDWIAIFDCADFVQMNKIEFELLSGRTADIEGIRKFAEELPLRNPQTLVITCANRDGYRVRRHSSRERPYEISLIRVPEPKTVRDPTGCGDIFSAAFVAIRLTQLPDATALNLAAAIATQRAESKIPFENLDFAQLIRRLITSRKAQNL